MRSETAASRHNLPGVYKPFAIEAKLAPGLAGADNAHLMGEWYDAGRPRRRPQNRSERFCTSRRPPLRPAVQGIEKASVERRRKRFFQRGRAPSDAVRR
jgi:hypothetical protein